MSDDVHPDDSAPDLSDPSDPSGAPATGFEVQGDRYARHGLLGEGGMGRVYVAEDRQLHRQVALKVAITPELGARLATEAWITAQLEHPGIVAVYDAGEKDGQAWYTMRLIRGRTLRDRLADCADTADRLELLPHLHAACQAVAFAHAMGIVHRDLKPANIMVGEFGETQVADWGLARPVDTALEDWDRIAPRSSLTGAAGTPRYMSPEQARGEPATTASDVFCLGAALFELLSGHQPPSKAGHPPDLGLIPDEVPPDLVAVARRALAVDPGERYPAAASMAEDLQRWRSGRRVQAHDYRPVELLRRLVSAWRAPLTVAAVATVALGAVAALGVHEAAQERAVADRNYAAALDQQALHALANEQRPEARVLAAHALALGPSPVARGVIAAADAGVGERLSAVDLPENCRHAAVVSQAGDRLACHGGNVVEVWQIDPMERLWSAPVQQLDAPVWVGEELALATPDGLAWGRDGVLTVVDPERSWLVPWAQDGRRGGVFGVQGRRVVSARPGAPVTTFEICASTRSTTGAFEDGLLVGCNDGLLRLYAEDGAITQEWPQDDRPPWSAMAQLGDRILVGQLDGTVRALDLRTETWTAPLGGLAGAVGELQPVPGTPLVVARGERGGPRLWNPDVASWLGALPSGANRLYPGPEPGELWVVSERLERWRLPAAPMPRVFAFSSGISQVATDRAGRSLAVALGEGSVEQRSLADGSRIQHWDLGDGVAKAVAFGPADQIIAASVSAGSVQLDADGGYSGLTLGSTRRVGILADGGLWGLPFEKGVRQKGPLDGAVTIAETARVFFDGSVSPSQDVAAFLDDGGGLWVLGPEGLSMRTQDPDAAAVDVGDGGSPLVWARQREVCVDGRCVALAGRTMDVSYSHGRIAVSTVAGDVWLLDAETLGTLALLRGHSGRVSSVEFGPDGSWLLSASWDGTVRRWDLTADPGVSPPRPWDSRA